MSMSHNKTEMSNHDFMCALLYIIENSCNLRAPPNKYGNRHTIYIKLNRCFKKRNNRQNFQCNAGREHHRNAILK